MEALSWNLTALSLYGFQLGQHIESKVINESIKISESIHETRSKTSIVVRKMLRRFCHTSLLLMSFVGGILLTAYLALTAKKLGMKTLIWM